MLLGIATIPLLHFFVTGSTFTATARHEVAALNFAQELMEEIKSAPYQTIFGTIAEGKAQAGDSNTITLEKDTTSSTDGFYNDCMITITEGTGSGQIRKISGYAAGDNHIATVSSNWSTVPDSTSRYRIEGPVFKGFAQDGTGNTITLSAGASSKADFYKNYYTAIISGKGIGQVKKVTEYNGSTKVATVEGTWGTIPDNTSVYQINEKQVDRYRYRFSIIEKLDSANENLRKITVKVSYPQGNLMKEVSLTTEKLKR